MFVLKDCRDTLPTPAGTRLPKDFNYMTVIDGVKWINTARNKSSFIHILDEATGFNLGKEATEESEEEAIAIYSDVWASLVKPGEEIHVHPHGAYTRSTQAKKIPPFFKKGLCQKKSPWRLHIDN